MIKEKYTISNADQLAYFITKLVKDAITNFIICNDNITIELPEKGIKVQVIKGIAYVTINGKTLTLKRDNSEHTMKDMYEECKKYFDKPTTH